MTFNVKAFLATISTILIGWLGGWDKPLQILVAFVILDAVAGLTLALKEKRFSSFLGLVGYTRKIGYFLVVIAANYADMYLLRDTGAPWLRTATALYYAAQEAGSFAANISALGIALPGFLTEFLRSEIERKSSKLGA